MEDGGDESDGEVCGWSEEVCCCGEEDVVLELD